MLPRAQRRRRRQKAEMNVVPYIDVMLVLLIIFMVTAPVLTQGVHVNLPKTEAKPISQVNRLPLIVTVDQSGKVYTNQVQQAKITPVSVEQLKEQVKFWLSTHQSQAAYIKADRSVPYGKVMQVMSIVQQAGASNIGLITQNTDEKEHG